MCSPASVILASIDTLLVSFGAILKIFKLRIVSLTSKVEITDFLFKIALKLTSILTILASIALAGEHIFQVLAQYS